MFICQFVFGFPGKSLVGVGRQGGQSFGCREYVVVKLVADDAPVAQLDVAAGVACYVGIVGYEDYGSAFGMELLEQYEEGDTIS